MLAHEIGHHLNNHDFEVTDKKKRKVMELQADKFAGGVLFILGASLDEAKAGIDLLQSQGESDTHPPAKARAEAIANGWKNSQEHHDKIKEVDPVKPPIKPDPIKPDPIEDDPIDDDVDFTAVSDAILANNMVGTWQCSFYNTYGQFTVLRAALYANGYMQVDTYTNSVFSAQFIGTWGVQNHHFIEYSNQTGVTNWYKIDMANTNMFTLTFAQTNGTLVVPVGTQWTYGRTY